MLHRRGGIRISGSKIEIYFQLTRLSFSALSKSQAFDIREPTVSAIYISVF